MCIVNLDNVISELYNECLVELVPLLKFVCIEEPRLFFSGPRSVALASRSISLASVKSTETKDNSYDLIS